MTCIGLIGSYHPRNFGDDLMAVIFALSIKRAGGQPLVWGLDRTLGERYGVEWCESLDRLCEEAEVVVLGGGHFLSARPREQFRRRRATKPGWLGAVEHSGLALYLASVGGSGGRSYEQLGRSRASWILRSPSLRGGTVRLPNDVAGLANLRPELPVAYFPDVVLSSPDFLGVRTETRQTSVDRVGINLSRRRLGRRASTIRRIAQCHRGVEFVYIDSHAASSECHFEFVPTALRSNESVVFCDDPKGALEMIGSLDLLISSNLHLGVAAMALGVPFMSVGGREKTQAFLSDVRSPGVSADWRSLSAIPEIDSLASILRSETDWKSVEEHVGGSLGHLDFVRSLVR
jgi:hypothetical protein